MPSERADGDPVEHFLVDGVAPPVIGGGPPESPFDVEPDHEPPTRHRPVGHRQAPSRPYGPPAQPGHNPPAGFQQHYPAGEYRTEPPTSPIPALQPPEQAPEKRKSWVSRMFRLPG